MRSEEEMYRLILDFAKSDERVRAVVQNGSRSNPNAPTDCYRDFDIVYYVTDVGSFTRDHSWIDFFGKRLMLQMPEEMRSMPDSVDDGHFGYLCLFEDGNRLDLMLFPIKEEFLHDFDSETILLLDKDDIIPPMPEASDSNYVTTQPSRLHYDSCCNNFFWCIQNVEKGIARDELPYAMDMYERVVRDELNFMLSWYIGANNGFSVSCGKSYKYFKFLLPQQMYEQYKMTYSCADYGCFHRAIDEMIKLFSAVAKETACLLGYTYSCEYECGMAKYIEMIRNGLEKD